MKKLVLTLVMGVFAFGMSGFNLNQIDPIIDDDCAEAAWNAGTEAAEQAMQNSATAKWAGLIAFFATHEYFTENCE